MTIAAASAMVAGGAAEAAPVTHWQGRALGAPASMQLTGLDPAEAQGIFRAVERELARLERIFSLYRPHSQISQLNRAGLLRAPAPELLEVLSLCDGLNRASNRAFDPTIQPLWQAHAAATEAGRSLSPAEGAALTARCGWHRLSYGPDEIGLPAGGALTLNGVAQGYITDRIAALLRARGLRDVLIDMGEIAAIGDKPWQVGIALPDGRVVERIALHERALATSAPMGTVLSPLAGLGHILDPRDPAAQVSHRLVTVSGPSAAVADGLSTALCLMQADEMASCLAHYPDATLETLI